MTENENATVTGTENATTSAPDTTIPKTRQRRLRSPDLYVEVTEERIANSIRRDSRHCMIAEAIKEAAPTMTKVDVDLASIRFTDPERKLRFIYITPRIPQLALLAFDQGITLEPFKFRLNKPAHIIRSHFKKGQLGTTKRDRPSYRKKQREMLDQVRASDDTLPFRPPPAYVEKVLAAMDDPNADLGPAVAVEPRNGSNESVPIFVGGNAPRHRGNIQRTRIFGLKQLVR